MIISLGLNNTPTHTHRANRLEIWVFPLPGRPTNTTQSLSALIGKILSGMELSILWPTAAAAPGAASSTVQRIGGIR